MATEPARAPACTLAGRELADRVDEWQALAATSLTAATATPHGVRLTFRPSTPVVHHLADLVAGERRCCAWAEWTLTSTGEETVVEASAAGGPPVRRLQQLFRVTS